MELTKEQAETAFTAAKESAGPGDSESYSHPQCGELCTARQRGHLDTSWPALARVDGQR